eukprot:TRINITY_DN1148_c0_g2_i2.p1 TRINITY_DN1148_c0_g2~~TRINITY_DN1148_c0_g2_i2.p1  ORF type:complete len:208 (-),score=13.78 TRINITY_DN1148_c0_g2_i2:209-832(-)
MAVRRNGGLELQMQVQGTSSPGERRDRDLRKLKESDKEFGIINERQEKRVLALETKLYNVANFYLVFQGVVLTAISQASQLKCHKWWIPFSLSLMTALVNGFAFAYTLIKYVRTKKQLEINLLERRVFQQHIKSLEVGSSNSVYWEQLNKGLEGVTPDHSKWRNHKIAIFFIVIFLVAFTILMLVACRVILCDCKTICEKDCDKVTS